MKFDHHQVHCIQLIKAIQIELLTHRDYFKTSSEFVPYIYLCLRQIFKELKLQDMPNTLLFGLAIIGANVHRSFLRKFSQRVQVMASLLQYYRTHQKRHNL